MIEPTEIKIVSPGKKEEHQIQGLNFINSDVKTLSKNNSLFQNTQRELSSKKKKVIIGITVGVVLVIGIICAITIPLVLKKEEEEKLPFENLEEKEILVIRIKRELNDVSRYKQESRSLISMNIEEEPQKIEQVMYCDILFNIYDVVNGTTNEGNLYYAIAIMNNMTLVNNGKSNFIGGLNLYDEGDHKYPGDQAEAPSTDEDKEEEENNPIFPTINETNCTSLSSNPCRTTIISIPMVKFSFYENGTLNDIYKPSLIDLTMWNTLLDAIKQFTPALSKSLYDNQLRRLDNTESLLRSFHKEGTNTILQETSINQEGIDGIEIDSSNIKMGVDTTVDEGQGKITSVASSGESTFVTTTKVLDDIPMNEDSPLSDIEKTPGLNTLTSGINGLSTKIETKLNLVSSTQESETTELIKQIAGTVTFTLFTKENIKESNRLRNLISLPFKEYKGDLTRIPNKLNALRLLKTDNFLRPIELSYSIFKINQLGIKMGLNIILSIDMQNDKVKGKAILIVSSHQLEVFNFDEKTDVKAILLKASGIVNELSQKIINLGNEALSLYNADWSQSLLKDASDINKILRNVFDLGERFLLFEDLESTMGDIIEASFDNFVKEITKALTTIEGILDSTLVDGKQISERLVEVLTINVKDFYSKNKEKLEKYDKEITGYLSGLFDKLNDLPNSASIDLDIYIETQEVIKKTIPIYEQHLDSMYDGIINSINDVIKEGKSTYTTSIGILIDDILVTLTTNPFLQKPSYAIEVNNAINSVKNIQKTITIQADSLFSLIHITKDNISTNPITKDFDRDLKLKMQLYLTNLKKQRDILIEKMNFYISKSALLLIKHFDSIQEIENAVKNIKIEAFKTYFNTSLIWNEFPQYIDQALKAAINIKLSQKEHELQSFILDIKFKSSEHYTGMNDYITQELNPIKNDLSKLFALSNLTPILNDLVTTVTSTWEKAQTVLEDNFKLANNYILNVINDYDKYCLIDGNNLKYYTSLFQNNYETGKKFMEDYIKNIKSKIQFNSVIKSIKDDWHQKILTMKNNPTNSFVTQLQEFAFIKIYFNDLDIVSQSFEDFFKSYEDDINTLMTNALTEFETQSSSLLETYKASHETYEKDSIKKDIYCDLFRDKAFNDVEQCHLVDTADNIIKMKDTFVLSEFSPNIKQQYTELLSQQNIYINKVMTSLKNIEDNHRPFYEGIGEDHQLKQILSAWNMIAIDFERQYLNQQLKTHMIKSLSDKVNEEGNKFIKYSQKNIIDLTQEYYNKFTESLNLFTFKPRDIPNRLEQIYTFVQSSFRVINTDINAILMQSIDYTLTYYYQLIEHQFTSFLNAFNDHFLLDISLLLKGSIQTKITALINDIHQDYQFKLSSMLMNGNLNNEWNTNWIKTEFNDIILPQFKTIIDNIKATIGTMTQSEDDYSTQSMKIEYLITNTIKGTSNIIPTAQNALDTCLIELNKEHINQSFEQISSISFSFLKSALSGYNSTLPMIESKIVAVYNKELINELLQYFTPLSIDSAFKIYLQYVFTFPFNTVTAISQVVNNFNTNIGLAFQKEIERIKQLQIPGKYIKRSYFVDLLNEYEQSASKKVEQYIINYMDTIYKDIENKVHQKLKEKLLLSITNINNVSSGNTLRTVPIFTINWSANEAITVGVTKSNYNINDYSNSLIELIKNKYGYVYKVANDIIIEIQKQLKIKIDKVINELVPQFPLGDTGILIETSEVFTRSIENDFTAYYDQTIQAINEEQIKQILLNQVNTVSLDPEVYGSQIDFKSKVDAFILKKINQMRERSSSIQSDITYYINNQLQFQSDTTLGLLFSKDTYYSQLKDKCVDPYLKLLWSSIDSKINDMSTYSLLLLENALTIKSSIVTNLPIIIHQFKTDFKKTIEETFSKKIIDAITVYLTTAQDKLPKYFETSFDTVIKNNDLNLLSIVQNTINSFDIRTIKDSFENYLTNEATQAQDKFNTPLQTEITNGIASVVDNLTKKFKEITDKFDLIVKETIDASIEAVYNELRAIIAQHDALISIPFTDYLFSIDPQVKVMFNTLFEKFTLNISPISIIFSDIKSAIEQKINEKIESTSLIDIDIQKEFKGIVDEVIASKDNIKSTIDFIKTIINEKITSFEQEVYNMFFGLRRNTDIRQTFELFSIADINNAITSLKNTMNNIKALITSTTNQATIRNAFTYYQSYISTGLTNIKLPINKIINVFKTILDPAFVNNFEATIDTGIENIKVIVQNNNDQMVNEINEILTYFKEYQYQIIDSINKDIKRLIDPQLNNLLAKVTTEVKPINEKKNYTSLDSPEIEIPVTIMNTPIVFTFKFTHHYSYGFNIAAHDLGIYMSAYVHDYTELSSMNAVNLGGVELGGRISGTVGEGKTSIGPLFDFSDFKTHLTSYAYMNASFVDIYSYSITPAITYYQYCTRKWYGKKKCRWEPIFYFDKKENYQRNFFEEPTNLTWDKLY